MSPAGLRIMESRCGYYSGHTGTVSAKLKVVGVSSRVSGQAASSVLTVRLFGKLDISVDGEQLTMPASARVGSLLSYLAMEPGVAQSRQRMAFVLWPDSTEAQARTNLRNVLHVLRRSNAEIADRIAVTPSTLMWRAGDGSRVDVAEFGAAVELATTAPAGSEERVGALRAAIELYRGDLLEDCYDEWLIAARERLGDLYMNALRSLAAELAGRLEHVEAVGAARPPSI
jgi:DNA-binding SARP family transcriptional activator